MTQSAIAQPSPSLSHHSNLRPVGTRERFGTTKPRLRSLVRQPLKRRGEAVGHNCPRANTEPQCGFRLRSDGKDRCCKVTPFRIFGFRKIEPELLCGLIVCERVAKTGGIIKCATSVATCKTGPI